jgi:hypothetical protein
MRLHRTARTHFFTSLGNEILRDNRLSFCARGILAHLLSLSDGQRTCIRTLTERTPEGRERVASALRELEQHGYLKREVKRQPDGRLFTEFNVFDTPGDGASPAGDKATPVAGDPGSGGGAPASDGDQVFKEQEKETTHPAPPPADAETRADEGDGREGGARDGASEEIEASADLLARVARAEPRLSLGRAEALRLAPLVAEWRRRGAGDLHVINALTAGLPRAGVHHPARFLEARLRAKMPAERRAAPARHECDECRVPIAAQGLCSSCRPGERLGANVADDIAQVRARGLALARSVLRGLSVAPPAPVPV